MASDLYNNVFIHPSNPELLRQTTQPNHVCIALFPHQYSLCTATIFLIIGKDWRWISIVLFWFNWLDWNVRRDPSNIFHPVNSIFPQRERSFDHHDFVRKPTVVAKNTSFFVEYYPLPPTDCAYTFIGEFINFPSFPLTCVYYAFLHSHTLTVMAMRVSADSCVSSLLRRIYQSSS